MDLKNKRVFVASYIRACDEEAIDLALQMKACGATFIEELNDPKGPPDVAVIAAEPREVDLAQIKALGIPTMDEEAFLRLLGIVPINERLELLRDLLAQEPSPQLWQEVCDHFDLCWLEFDEDLALGLSYADEHMDHWPDEWRVLPRHWEPDPEDEHHYAPFKAQLARVCNPEDPDNRGYLISVESYMRFEPDPKPPTSGGLSSKDPATGQRLVWSSDAPRLLLKDSDGNTLAQTPFELPNGHDCALFSACGACVWLLAYGPDNASQIYLLDRNDLSIKDHTPLRQPDMSEHEIDRGWDQDFMISPDGKRLGVANNTENCISISCVFWHEEGKIKVVNTPFFYYEYGNIAGFSPDSTRFLHLAIYEGLRVWDLNTGQKLASTSPHAHNPTNASVHYSLDSADRMHYGETFLFLPLDARNFHSWGIAILDAHTGEHLGCVAAPRFCSRREHEPINILSDRLCECPCEGKLRYLPSLTFLQNHASTRHDAAAQDD